MREYVVYEPPQMAATREERAESLLFVQDGFSWGAALFGPFYFIFRGEWLGLLLYIVAGLLFGLVSYTEDARMTWASLLPMALNIIAGFEANEVKRWSLERAGWRELGTVGGRNCWECERRFLEAWLPNEPPVTPAAWMSGGEGAPRPFTIEGMEQTLRAFAERLRSRYAARP